MKIPNSLTFIFSGFFIISVAGCGEQSDTGQQTENDQQEEAVETTENPDVEDTESGSAEFHFESLSHDFGHVKLGEKAKNRFEFTNTGNEPLVIQRAEAGCGCTVPDYTQEPVEPGKKGYVDVEYNSQNRPLQRFNQSVRVFANVPDGQAIVTIRGEVVGPDGEPADDAHAHHNHSHDHDEEQDGPAITFESNSHNFGEVEDGDVVTHRFRFVNTGTEPLEIEDAEARCGCTVPEFSKDPIQPGEEGFIDVSYDTNVRNVSEFHQPVNITANTSQRVHNLSVSGTVNK